ncbi:MAG: RNA polymerase-binding transcription factor DksA [Syntrophus sp. SKADARSKE-3]|nr:RNA polymerase-binding transcription factor DksA [Syntrophus sp. SKADARSKE-3]
MNSNKINLFRSLLLDNLHELQSSAGKTSSDMKSDEKLFSDPVDRANVELGRGIDLIIRSRDRLLIHEIEDALVRLDRGEFGVCPNCGERISQKRLFARPTSLLCIDCKEKEEGRWRHSSHAQLDSYIIHSKCAHGIRP